MKTWEALKRRVSVREYSAKPVTKVILKKLVDAGRRAPTAMGEEPWEFVVVTAASMIASLGKAVAPCDFVAKARACIAVYCRDTKYWLEDGCAATENILIAASDIGLGACWIAGQSEPWGSSISSLLKVRSGFKLVSMVALGWPVKRIRQKKKRTLNGVIHWEGF